MPAALFALTVTLYVVAEGRLAAGTVQVAPVQLSVAVPSFQTYAVGVLLQAEVSNGDAERSVTDGVAGVIALQADRGRAFGVGVTRIDLADHPPQPTLVRVRTKQE